MEHCTKLARAQQTPIGRDMCAYIFAFVCKVIKGTCPSTYATLSELSAEERCRVGRQCELTSYHVVVQLIALGVEVLLHSRDVGIGNVLLAEKLVMYGQYRTTSTESDHLMYTLQKTVSSCVSFHLSVSKLANYLILTA
jgi:hypothetical protein